MNYTLKIWDWAIRFVLGISNTNILKGKPTGFGRRRQDYFDTGGGGGGDFLITENGNFLITENGNFLITE